MRKISAQVALQQPEDYGRGDADGGQEGLSAKIAVGVDAAPDLEFAEYVFDLLALAVERGVVRDRHLAVGLQRDPGSDTTRGCS